MLLAGGESLLHSDRPAGRGTGADKDRDSRTDSGPISQLKLLRVSSSLVGHLPTKVNSATCTEQKELDRGLRRVQITDPFYFN